MSRARRNRRRAPLAAIPSSAGISTWEWPLLAALLLAPTLAGGLDAAPVAIIELLIWAAFAGRVLLPGERARPLPRPPAIVCLLAFCGFSLASIATSVNRGASMAATAEYAAWLAGAVLAADLAARPGGAARVLGGVLAGAALAAADGMRSTIGNGLMNQWYWRQFGPFLNPNLYASCLLTAIPVALAFLLCAPRVTLLLPGFLGLLLVSQLMFTGSRGGLAALLAGLLVFVVVGIWRQGLLDRRLWLRLVVFAVVALPIAWLSSPALKERSFQAAQDAVPSILCPMEKMGGTSDSNRFRVLTWKGTLRMARERPLLGFGAGTFEFVYPRYAEAGFTRRAHQSFLQYAAELGTPAAALWVAALGLAFWQRVRRPRLGDDAWWSMAAAAAIAGSSAHNLIDYSWFIPGTAVPFWVVLGLAAGAREPDPCPAAGRPATRRPPALWLIIAAPFIWVGAATGIADRDVAEATEALGRTRSIEARELLEQAIQVAPWDQAPRSVLGSLYIATDRPRQAIDAYLAALDRAPTYGPLYYRLGRAYELARDFAGAAAAYRRGIAWSPQSTELHQALAQALERAGDPAGALDTYRRLTEIESSPYGQVHAIGDIRDYRYSLAHEALARAAAARGDEEAARREFRATACGLARIRSILGSGLPYLVPAGLGVPELRKDLQQRESSAWRWLADDYRRHGNGENASAAEKMAATALEPIHVESGGTGAGGPGF